MSCHTESEICIYRGDDYDEVVLWQNPDGSPADLTGYTVKMQIRDSRKSRGTPALQLTEGSGLTVTHAAGRIDIKITGAQTTALLAGEDSGVHDLEVVAPDGKVTTLINGPVKFTQDVTR